MQKHLSRALFRYQGLPAEALPIALGYGTVIAAALASRWLHRLGKSWAAVPVIAAAVAAPLLIWLGWWTWATTLAPDASGQSAAVFVILALQATVSAIALLIAAYLGWRVLRGLVVPVRNNTVDLTCLFLGYSGAQGMVGTLFVRAIGA